LIVNTESIGIGYLTIYNYRDLCWACRSKRSIL